MTYDDFVEAGLQYEFMYVHGNLAGNKADEWPNERAAILVHK